MMKRIVSILLVFLLSVSMVACGTEKKTGDTNQEQKAEDAKGDDELSQSEWMAEHAGEYEDGYEVVDDIDIDTSELSLKYTGYEIVDDVDDNDEPIKRIIVHFDFTNKTSVPMSSSSTFSCTSYQNGIELQAWGGTDELNDMTNIKDGATINVGFMFDLIDATNTVEINVSEGLTFEGTEIFAQKQEIIIGEN